MASLYEDILIRVKGQDDTGSVFSGVTSKVSGLRMAMGAAATMMGSQMLSFSQSCITAATGAEAGWNAFNTALARVGSSSQSTMASMKKDVIGLARDLGRSTGDVRQAMIDFMNFGADAKTAMQGASAASAIAAAKNMDYAESEQVIMSAMKGRGMQLKTLGIDIKNYKDSTTGAIDTTRLFNDILSKYGSSQAAYADSAVAKQIRLQNAIAAFKTSVGQALLPVLEAVIPVITLFARAMDNPIIAGFAAVVIGIGGALTFLAGPIMAVTGLMGVLGIEAISLSGILGVLGTAFTIMTGPVGITIMAITAVIAILVLAYQKCDWFRNGVNQLAATLISVGQRIVGFFQGIANTVVGFVNTVRNALGSIASMGGSVIGGIGAALGGAGGAGAGDTYQGHVLGAGNPSYTNSTTNRSRTVVLQEGALQVDARNLSTHEAKQVLIGALEDINR